MKTVIMLIIALTVIIGTVVTYFVVVSNNKPPTFNRTPGYIFNKHPGYKHLYSATTVDECEKICDTEPECAAFQFQIPAVSDKIPVCSLFKSGFTPENIKKTDLPGYVVGINASKEFFSKQGSTSKM